MCQRTVLKLGPVNYIWYHSSHTGIIVAGVILSLADTFIRWDGGLGDMGRPALPTGSASLTGRFFSCVPETAPSVRIELVPPGHRPAPHTGGVYQNGYLPQNGVHQNGAPPQNGYLPHHQHQHQPPPAIHRAKPPPPAGVYGSGPPAGQTVPSSGPAGQRAGWERPGPPPPQQAALTLPRPPGGGGGPQRPPPAAAASAATLPSQYRSRGQSSDGARQPPPPPPAPPAPPAQQQQQQQQPTSPVSVLCAVSACSSFPASQLASSHRPAAQPSRPGADDARDRKLTAAGAERWAPEKSASCGAEGSCRGPGRHSATSPAGGLG